MVSQEAVRAPSLGRVFLSHASTDRELARAVQVRLRAAGCNVFLDSNSLSAGESFESRIRAEVAAADLFVFFISPASVAAGRFTLTELALAEARWPRPDGRVLPIMVQTTPLEAVPAYLGQLTILETKGNRAAEVAQAVLGRIALADFDPKDPESEIGLLVDELDECLRLRRRAQRGPNALAVPGVDLPVRINRLVADIRARWAVTRGTVVAGAKLVRVLGSGNFGTVWHAEDLATGEPRAVKVFGIDKLDSGVMLWRFRRSIRALRLLGEPKRLKKRADDRGRIVQLFVADDSSLAFSMELLGQGSLEAISTLDWSLARKIQAMLSICSAVAYAHANGIIHRDIKPANIVLSDIREPVLTDFDIADIKFSTSLSTVVEAGLGTPVFAAPEQLTDADEADERSDVYSLGRLLHFLLLERSPGLQIEAEPALENLNAHPPALVEVVRRATQLSPTRRFQSVAEMSEALENYETGRAAWAARRRRAWRAIVRNRSVIAIVSLFTAGLCAFALYQADEAKRETALRLSAESQKRRADDALSKLAALASKFTELENRKYELSVEKTRLTLSIEGLEKQLTSAAGAANRQRIQVELNAAKSQLQRVEEDMAVLVNSIRETQDALARATKPKVAAVPPSSPCVQKCAAQGAECRVQAQTFNQDCPSGQAICASELARKEEECRVKLEMCRDFCKR